jgi:hypothetical protein
MYFYQRLNKMANNSKYSKRNIQTKPKVCNKLKEFSYQNREVYIGV